MSLSMGMIRNLIPSCVPKHEFANHLAQRRVLKCATTQDHMASVVVFFAQRQCKSKIDCKILKWISLRHVLATRPCNSKIDCKILKWIRDSGAEWMQKCATTQDRMALAVTSYCKNGNVSDLHLGPLSASRVRNIDIKWPKNVLNSIWLIFVQICKNEF